MMSLVTLLTKTIWLLIALVIDYFFFMLSGLIMFFSLVLVLHFIGFFGRNDIAWRDVDTIGYIMRDFFLYMWIAITLEALLLHVSARA